MGEQKSGNKMKSLKYSGLPLATLVVATLAGCSSPKMWEGTAGQNYDDFATDSRYCRAIAQEMAPVSTSSRTEQKIDYGTPQAAAQMGASAGRAFGQALAQGIGRSRQAEVFDNCMENKGYRQR